MKHKITKTIDQILKRGTRVVSFKYHGVPRNVLIGAESTLDFPNWGRTLNTAIREHSGKRYLVGVEANLPYGREIRIFSLSKIRCPSFL